MKEYTLEDLATYASDKVLSNYTAIYNPEKFWEDYGKIYRNTFSKDKKDKESGNSVNLNVDMIASRVFNIQRDYENKDIKVLEIGCGFGRILPNVLLGCNLSKIYGVEHSPTMIEDSKNYLKNFDKAGDIEIRLGKAQQLPYEDKSFDLSYTHVCLTHIPPKDIPAVTKEISRVTKGWIIHVERFSFPYEHPNPHRWSHLLVPYYLDLGWEVVENSPIHETHKTNILVLRRGGDLIV
jgi:SAM-dependent methyltransferase